MKKSVKNSQKIFLTIIGGLMIVLLFFVSSCSEDEDLPTTLAGTYQLEKATLKTGVTIGGIPIPGLGAGTDISSLIEDYLLSEAPCDTEGNQAISFAEGGTLKFVCVGETNELNAGTWTENEALTELTMDIGVTDLDLETKIEQIKRTKTSFTGQLPDIDIPKDVITSVFTDIPSESLPDNVSLSVEVKFVLVEETTE